MKIVYQSEDGKIFSTEEACRKHENEVLLAKHKMMKDAIDTMSGELSLMIGQYAKAINAKPKMIVDPITGRIIATFIQN